MDILKQLEVLQLAQESLESVQEVKELELQIAEANQRAEEAKLEQLYEQQSVITMEVENMKLKGTRKEIMSAIKDIEALARANEERKQFGFQ
ncbi:hypothetical protein [Alkalicoccobacillus gibsonii]|uniref:hypothetical protein n=1 Tax=Alkalicoccobacillus gibsonii TaxID=79881 RepID=UPI0035147712